MLDFKQLREEADRRPFAAEAASDDDRTSGSPIVDTLQHVWLDKDREKYYNQSILPSSSFAFLPAAEAAAEAQKGIEMLLAVARTLYANAYILDAKLPEDQMSDVASIVDTIAAAFNTGNTLLYENYFFNLSTGLNPTIKKVANGVDVLFVGTHASPVLMNTGISYGSKVPMLSSDPKTGEPDPIYQANALTSYVSAFGQKVTQAMTEIFSFLLGSPIDPANMARRQTFELPLDFPFAQISDIFYKHFNTVLPLSEHRIDAKTVKQFKNTIKLAFVIRPHSGVKHWVATGTNAASLGQHVSKEGILSSIDCGMGIVLHLDQDIVSYVTQSGPKDKPNMFGLNSWVRSWAPRFLRGRGQRLNTNKVKRSQLPKYVLPPSAASKVTDIRRESGYTVEQGKGDENNIFIASTGGLRYGLPSAGRAVLEDNAREYESRVEAFLDFLEANGLPIGYGTLDKDTAVAAGLSDGILAEHQAHLKSLREMSGVALASDWDYAMDVIVQMDNPADIRSEQTIGSAKVDDLVLADYLGMNLAAPGQDPIERNTLNAMLALFEENKTTSEEMDKYSSPESFYNKFFGRIVEAYAGLLASEAQVPTFSELVAASSRALNITDMDEAPWKQSVIYARLLERDGTARDLTNYDVHNIIAQTFVFCAGSHLLVSAIAEAENLTTTQAAAQVEDAAVYFDVLKNPLAQIANTYNLVGGKLLQLISEYVSKADPALILSYKFKSDLNYNMITRQVMPAATMLAKYVPDAVNIFRRGEELADTNRPDPSIDVDDINIAGCVDGSQLFPHQVQTHKSLRRKPKFSILDIAPGGGKTILGITDMTALVTEMEGMGERIIPAVLCPDRLIGNWCDDLQIACGTNWNVFPINTNTFHRWTTAQLSKMVSEAPPNTIYVIGFNCLKSAAIDVPIGGQKVRISNNAEFIRNIGINYYVIDESQKLAKLTSQVHKAVKRLTTASTTKYIRLATGSFIHGRVSDAIGQTSLYNGHIFRDGDVLTAKDDDVMINGEAVSVWKVDTPARARQKLARYASVITFKKKNWAFMLPSPVERFHMVQLQDESVEFSELHNQLYEAVLEESVEAINEMAKTLRAKNRVGDDDDDDDDGDEDEGAELNENSIGDLDADDVDGLPVSALEPYIARLETLIVNPMADPLAPSIFGYAGVNNFVSPVVKQVTKIVEEHFNPEAWSRDKVYKEYSLVQHNSKMWLAKKVSTDTSRIDLPEQSKGIEPQNASDYWREEPEGKLIIFCRYVNSVNGVYDGLPDKFRSMAVKFTGQEADKEANLEAFKTDPRVKIIIANEQGMSEGHNLQIGSRMIRVESPWSPGDLDQSASRIFRPDPAAAKAMRESGKAGTMYREIINLDWILCSGTLQIEKQARLIAKVFHKCRFDEFDNDLYQHIFNQFDLEEIPMSMKLFRSRSTINEYAAYVNAYSQIVNTTNTEFAEMRRNFTPSMESLTPAPLLQNMKPTQVPFVPNQKPYDREGLGLKTLRTFVRDPKILADLDQLAGTPVVTEFGKGRIVSVRTKVKRVPIVDENGQYVKTPSGSVRMQDVVDGSGNPVINEFSPLSSVRIKLVSGETINVSNPGLVQVPTKLDAKSEAGFKVQTGEPTAAEKRRIAIIEQKEAEREEAELLKEAKARKKAARAAADRVDAVEKAKKRKDNIKNGRPTNKGVTVVKSMKVDARKTKTKAKAAVPAFDLLEDGYDNEVNLLPAYYHGYLTLEAQADDPDAVKLKKLGFKPTGPYAFVKATRYAQFDKILDYIDDNFEYSSASAKRLEAIQDAFDDSPKAVYRMELAPQSSLPYFFATSKRKVTNRKEVRPFPIILPDETHLAIDITTCPAVIKHIGRSVPGANTKWTKHPGHYLYFAKNKADLKAKLKEVEKAGLVVTNKADCEDDIASIKFRAPTGKK